MKIVDAARLNGREGFALTPSAATNGAIGRSVAIAGDVDADGVDDLLIGLPTFFEDGERRGESFLVYGKLGRRPFDGLTDLLALDGADGVRIGAVGGDAFEQSGWSVSAAGDLNADGIDDMVIGAIGGTAAGGRAHVVFGREGGFGAALELGALGPGEGFALEGSASYSLGRSVAAAGDVDGDGVDDLAVGGNAGFQPYEAVFVVYGRRGGGFDPTIFTDDLDGGNGLRFEPIDVGIPTGFGTAVASAGDFDGDGRADLIAGAPEQGRFFDKTGGAVYLMFGEDQDAPEVPPPVDDPAERRAGLPGAEVASPGPGDRAGFSVAGGGDVNGDGFDDVIVGVPGAEFGGAPLTGNGGPLNSGSVFLLFGGPGHAQGLSWITEPLPGSPPETLLRQDGRQAMRIDGERSRDGLGGAVAIVGDVNGDGIDDFAIAASGADPHGLLDEGADGVGDGAVYVIYGRAGGFPGLLDLTALRPGQGFRIDGPEGAGAVDGRLGAGVAGGGDLNGDGLADVVVQTGAPGGRETAQVYVIYGFHAPTNGDDRLLGGQLRDRIDGRGGDDVIVGRGAADALKGGRGADVLRGGGGRDALEGDGGRDLLKGGGGRDALRGGGGGDDLQGEAGADRLFGGSGGDVLTGGRGRDVLVGGGGRDVFLFQGRSGVDVIRDFQQGRDLIEIASAARFGELELTARGGGVEIGFDGGSVLVRGASLEAFDADDFVF